VKKNPNDELRFLMKNPTRSDFFIGMTNLGFLCVVTSSCWMEFVMSQSLFYESK